MSFCFNFPQASDYEVTSCPIFITPDNECVRLCDYNKYRENCDFLILSEESLKCTAENISLLRIGDVELKYVLLNSAEIATEDEIFSQICTLETDIIPGKYEGGLKIWECSIDLANYVSEHISFKSGDQVLELGCGAGIPGIIAYLKGASVTFQDYNEEVLQYFTIPNTVLNTPPDKLSIVPEMCHYLYGDWGSIQKEYYTEKVTLAPKYDYILTSETIYEKENQEKLLKLMRSALKPDGTIYLAAKIFYFGVGGGIADFEALVKRDRMFEITSVHRIPAGVERQILVMKFRHNHPWSMDNKLRVRRMVGCVNSADAAEKSAEELANKAECVKDISLFIKANALRKNIKEKVVEMKNLDEKISETKKVI